MHRVITLPVAGDRLEAGRDGGLGVRTERIALAVDVSTGAVTPAVGERPDGVRRDDPAVVLPAVGLRLSERETDAGPETRLLDAGGATLAVFPGMLRSIAVGDDGVFAGSVARVGGETEVIAGRLGAPDLLRIAGGGGAACAGVGFVAITGGEPPCLHVFRARGGDVSRTSIARPGPEGNLGGALFSDGVVWVLAGATLAGISVADLGEAAGAMGATFAPLAPPPRAAAERAKVAFALASGTMGVDHPRFGRIVMARGPGDPSVARGDEIALDDVVEELPGVFRVRAWHVPGAGGSHRPPPPPIELAPPEVRAGPLDGSSRAASPTRAPEERLDRRLLALAARHGFAAPTTLLRLLGAAEDDAVVARWLSRLMCEPELYFPCVDWDADPFLVSFGGVGNGDAFCLYPYPPALGPGGEPPVVEFFHETNLGELRAPTFDAFLSSWLAERAADGDAEIVGLLVSRLGLPPPRLLEPPPPASWLPTYETDDDLLERADALIAEGELELAERVLVSRFVGDGAQVARGRLEDVYQRLGWTLPLEILRSAE